MRARLALIPLALLSLALPVAAQGTYPDRPVANLAKEGRVRILAVSDDERDPRMPNVPTFKEAGLPSLGLDTTIGLHGPAGLPRTVVTQWSDAIGRMAKMPDVETTLESAGFDVWYKPAAEMEAYHRAEVPRLGRIIKEANVKMD